MQEKHSEKVTVPLLPSQLKTLDEYRVTRVPPPSRQQVLREFIEALKRTRGRNER